MGTLKVNRNNGIVTRNGEKIGSVIPAPWGWIPVDNEGVTDHYFMARLQRDAVARVEVLFDRQSA